MIDGIDHKAFKVGLATLDRAEREYRVRELSSWFRAAAGSENARRQSLCAVAGIAVWATLSALGSVAGIRSMLAASQVLLVPSLWFGLASNRSARKWRRDHPFEQWLGVRA